MRKEKGTIIFFGLIAVDQLSKHLFRLFGLTFVNQGISFNLLPHFPVVLLLSLIVLLGVSTCYYRSPRLSLLFILVGGLSNLIDRLAWGGVVDFIRLPPFPSFNLADIMICLGTALLLVDLPKRKKLS